MSDHQLPVVGISAYQAEAAWGSWHTRATLLPATYVEKIAAAGGAPVVVPPSADATSVIARLDALVLSGGPDVDPSRYGVERHERTRSVDAARDAGEEALLAAALGAGIPTLAICRGLQLLNVVRGGTLHQHLPEVVGDDVHQPSPGVFGHNPVTVQAGSRLAAVLGDSEPLVACHHHQGVDRVGDGLVPVAWSNDGTVEALESDHEARLLAVQWHPEEGDDLSLFVWLVGEARRRLDAERGAGG